MDKRQALEVAEFAAAEGNQLETMAADNFGSCAKSPGPTLVRGPGGGEHTCFFELDIGDGLGHPGLAGAHEDLCLIHILRRRRRG